VGRKCCKCNCFRPNSNKVWLFSRYSSGWVCGVHSDFTSTIASGCVDRYFSESEEGNDRKYFLTTFLRNPVDRFISEYSHIHRGVNWSYTRGFCGRGFPTAAELPLCFDPEIGWSGVSLNEFISCPFNQAFNRQARMLADLNRVNCYSSDYDRDSRDEIILESAKANLQAMPFFGIKERMDDSQFLFENVFKLRFTKSLSSWNISKSSHILPANKQIERIRELNNIDIKLYDFALNLFEERLKQIRKNLNLSPFYNDAQNNLISVV